MILSLKRSLQCRQVGQVQFNLSVDGASVTPAASGPDAAFVDSITDLGAGNYTITIKEAAKLALFVSGLVAITPDVIGCVTATTVNSVTVQFNNAAGAATDADFMVQFQYADQLSYYF